MQALGAFMLVPICVCVCGHEVGVCMLFYIYSVFAYMHVG